jgi:hypothetical protein
MTGAELMLITVDVQPLVPLPPEFDFTPIKRWEQKNLAETRDALAPDALTVVQPDVWVWHGLREVVRTWHRDLLVVGSAHDANDGPARLGRDASELVDHLECPLAVAPSRPATIARTPSSGSEFD